MKKLSENFKVEKFGFFSKEDPTDMLFQHEICWSRIYEYPFVLNEIKNSGIQNPKIHNCSWGFRDMHVIFKTCLDLEYKKSYHSDITPSTLYNCFVWDITETPRDSLKNHFDIVLNISTLEEVKHNHVEVLENHLEQLNDNGLFIGTFDYPGLQLDKIEDYLGIKIKDCDSRLNPKNSRLPDKVLNLPKDFFVGYLVIRKCSQ